MKHRNDWMSMMTTNRPEIHFLSRAWQFFRTRYLHRSIPHGVVTIQYLFPNCTPALKGHFRIWRLNLPDIPLPIALGLEFILWLRWVLFFGWTNTWRCVRKMGPEYKREDGTGLFWQFRRALFLSLFYCIPPGEIYAFRLIRKDRKSRSMDYVFTHELPGFHRWRNAGYGQNHKSMTMLQDKYRFTSLMEQQGVPMVPIFTVLSRNSSIDLSSCLKNHSPLLCKPRHGSAAKEIFVVTSGKVNEQPEIFATRSGVMTSQTTTSCLQEALSMDDYLVQPFMINHPLLAELCNTQDVVTIRIITELQPRQVPAGFCALLEIPVMDDDSSKFRYSFHLIVPIDLDTGEVKPFTGDLFNPSVRERYEQIYAKMSGKRIPFWKEMYKNAVDAHRLFDDVHAIAWDFVVTPEGALLLEGNTGWASRVPQTFNGALLNKGLQIL